MSAPDSQHLPRPTVGQLTLLYVCALGTVALLILFGQFAIQRLIEAHSHDSILINVAGRQRMLSQRIAKSALAIAAAEDARERERYTNELGDAVSEWTSAHVHLRDRRDGDAASPEIAALFHMMEAHFAAIVRASDVILAGDPRKAEAIERILTEEPQYLSAMEQAVAQYEAEALAHVRGLSRTEMMLAAAALGVLLLEALFVFRPAVASIRRSFSRLSESEVQRQRMADELKTIFDSVPALILYHDREGAIVRVNRSGAEILGASMYRLERSSIYELFPGQEAQSRDEDAKIYGSGEPLLGVLRAIRNYEGDMRWLRMNKVPYRDIAGAIAGIILFAVDVSAHKRLELRLMELTTEAERRLGYDLHDGLGQHLSGILYLSKRLKARLVEKEAEEQALAGEILASVKEAVNTVRDMSKGLRPLGEHPSDLSQALIELAAATQSTTGIRCTFGEASPVLIFSAPTAEHLYRIAQEAVNNAVRHSQATEITIHLDQSDEATRLTIRDDGVGFHLRKSKRPQNAADDGGMGLSIMEHRTHLLGGQFSIETAPGAGTRVQCAVET